MYKLKKNPKKKKKQKTNEQQKNPKHKPSSLMKQPVLPLFFFNDCVLLEK